MRLPLLLIVLGMIVTAGAQAQLPTVGLYTDATGSSSEFFPNEPYGIMDFFVIASYTPGITAVQYSAPIPGCFTGAVCVGEDVQFPVYIGNSPQGIAIAMGACLTGSVHVSTLHILTTVTTDLECYYPVLPSPHAETGQVEIVDCFENLLSAIGLTSYIGCDLPPDVTLLYPPDSATAVPLNAQLDWRVERNSSGMGVVWSEVYFGTTDDPPLVAPYGETPYDPGPLQPETEYFWKINAIDTGASEPTMSPLWRFTTEGPVPVGRTSWGAIKELYNQ